MKKNFIVTYIKKIIGAVFVMYILSAIDKLVSLHGVGKLAPRKLYYFINTVSNIFIVFCC